jgi:hypothetical protein
MTAYRIVQGTLLLGPALTWAVRSGGVVFDEADTQWRAYLDGANTITSCPPLQECSLTVDLEGGGQLRGACCVVELDAEHAQVKSDCLPEQFLEPACGEAD